MIKKLKTAGVAAGFIVAILILIYGASWIITCGLIKLITICFGWTFKWTIATGIWLIILIARTIFSSHTTVKK